MKHLINSMDIDRAGYDELIRRTKQFIADGISPDLCRGKVVATIFLQPSTRTQGGFQSAMMRAGGGWLGISGIQGTSMEKGETFEDTINSFSDLADTIVIRHPDDDAGERAVSSSRVPIINGGSGSREHAVGAAMMLGVLAHHMKRPLEGATIGIYGTPEINRVCKAIVPVFGLFGVSLMIDDLGHFPVSKEIEEKAKEAGLKNLTYGKLDDFIGDVDALLVTRGLQKGIIPDNMFPKEKEEAILKSYKPITTAHMKKMRDDAILSMILPRIFEIDRAVDKDPRAIYTKDEHFVEMALAVMTYLLDIAV